jgi:hypothetical protein
MVSLEWRRFVHVCALAASLIAGMAALAAAQTDNAGIVGRVVDESGAVLPGVTVTATSPSLQVPNIATYTDAQGEYRLTQLPQGSYNVRYELPGFQAVAREGVRLGVAFVATVNVTMTVGGIQETVTVSGVSPVVDVTTTTPMTQFIRETLEELPTTRNSQVTLAIQAPGVRINGSGFDIGGSKFTTGAQWNKFGRSGDDHALLDGVRIGPEAGDYQDFSSIDEAQVQTTGSSAEMAGSGVRVSSIIKSGGNSASGTAYYSQHLGDWALANNIDDELRAAGLTGYNKLRGRYDFSGDLGGRLIYNKLWFYTGARRAMDDPIIAGADTRPDGSPGSAPRRQAFYTTKLSWQLSNSQRLVGLYQGNWKFNIRAVGPFNTWESRMLQDQYGQTRKIEWQKVAGSSMTFNAIWGYWDRNFPTNGMAYGQVATFDQVTQKYTGDHISLFRTPIDANVDRTTLKATMTYFRSAFYGEHDIKAGYENSPVSSWSEYPSRGASGDYYLVFQRGVPYQFVTYHGPLQTRTEANYNGAYVQDAWKIKRLVLNLGIRFDRHSAWVPEQSTAGGFNTNPYTQPRVSVPTLNNWAPRLHFAFDLSGQGKTVIKGGWGQFNRERPTGDTSGMNGNASRTTTYRWNDRNGNKQWDDGEVDLSVSGPDYVSGAGADPAGTLRIANPDEKAGKQDEFSLNFEHELLPDLGFRVSGVYITTYNLRRTALIGRPLESWNVPVTNRDPGPDGVIGGADDGDLFTYWEYPTSLRAPTFGVNWAVNAPGLHNVNKGIDLAVQKRSSRGWQLLVSGGRIWIDDEQVGEPQETPNALLFNADKHTEWYFKAGGSYRLIKPGILLAANFNGTSGQNWQRTVRFTGGVTIPSIVLPVEPRDARRYPNAYVLDVRGEKSFGLGGTHRLSIRMDVFNALNTNVLLAVNTQSGPSFGLPTSVMPARVFQTSASYKF